MKSGFIAAFFLIFFASSPAYAGGNDYVVKVYSCGDDVGIEMQNAGWLVVEQATVGEKRVDRIMSIALTMLTTGKPAGFFNDTQPGISWCGVPDAKPITVLSVAT